MSQLLVMYRQTCYHQEVMLIPDRTENYMGNALEHNKESKMFFSLKEQHPDKRIMLVADKGTMGVGSSRMSGVNNVALWTGIQASPYVPFINIAPIVGGTNGISPIFLTTVGVTGVNFGIDLKKLSRS